MAHGIVGRQTELDLVEAFLDDVSAGATGLVVVGEPGIGKTTLWKAGTKAATDRGWLVLQARPVESEAKLSLATLSDLLEPVLDKVVSRLPEPQRRALDVALLRAEPDPANVDPRTLAVAVMNTLRALADDAPILVAVDDLQWVDGPSARALSFAVRRLGPSLVGILAAQRRGSGPAFDPAAGLADDRVARMELGPLSLAAVGRMLDAKYPGLPRHILRQVHRTSGGNPFYAEELVRALGGLVLEPGQPLPVPADLRALLSARLQGLGSDARQAVLAAACLAQPTLPAVTAALGEEALAALAEATKVGIVHLEGERLRFSHPLLASTAYAEAGPEHTRALHRRLARVLDEPEERARHLALATAGPDSDAAAALDLAAAAASVRGAPGAAAELCEQAMALTPRNSGEDSRRRRLAAAAHHFSAGDQGRARTLLEEAVTAMPSGPERAQVLGALAEVRSRDNDLSVATELLVQALDEAGANPEVRIPLELHLQLWLAHRGEAVEARASAHRALALAEPLAEPGLLSVSLAAVTWVDYLDRRGVATDRLARALALENGAHPFSVIYRPSFTAGAIWTVTGSLNEACDAFARLYQWVHDRGDESSIPLFGIMPVLAECRRGGLSGAERYADGVAQASQYIGASMPLLLALNARTIVDAYRGDATAVHQEAKEAVALAERFGANVLGIVPTGMIGFVALSAGDPAGCHQALGPIMDTCPTVHGIAQVFCVLFAPDEVEALVAVGELERAATLLDWSEDNAALGGPWAEAAATRGRALLAAARGNLDAAIAGADDSVSRYRQLPMPVDRGRSLLVKGQVHRRRKEKAAAKVALEEAQAIFERAGAVLWSQRAREELARVGLRRSAPTDLTPTEARVAELVAEGLTNREVAERAFLTPKSVEGVVARVYRKLGIHSRAELGAAMSVRASVQTGQSLPSGKVATIS